MFGLDQLEAKFSNFKSYFQASDDLLTSIVLFGALILVAMIILLKVSRILQARADQKKFQEFEEVVNSQNLP